METQECPACGGSGDYPDTKWAYGEITWLDCPDCRGLGYVEFVD